MVKFSKQLELQLVPEWRTAFCNYWKLKKELKLIRLNQSTNHNDNTAEQNDDNYTAVQRITRLNVVKRRKHILQDSQGDVIRVHQRKSSSGAEEYETEVVMEALRGGGTVEAEIAFFTSVDSELNKVNSFYVGKEAEYALRLDALRRQLSMLIGNVKAATCNPPVDVRVNIGGEDGSHIAAVAGSPSSLFKRSLFTPFLSRQSSSAKPLLRLSPAHETKQPESYLQPNVHITGVDDQGHDTLKINVTDHAFNVHQSSKQQSEMAGNIVNKRKLHYSRKMLRTAFVEYYRGLRLLQSFSSLNMLAFGKILKKYDKVTGRNASMPYLKALEMSHLNSSDKVPQMMDDVEKLFTQYFAKNDQKKGMMLLRPVQQRVCHTVTYFVGLFSGWSLAFFASFMILIHCNGSHFSGSNLKQYWQTMYPTYSMLFLVLLHMYMYGWNVYLWRQARINYPFIFEFAPSTELRNREILLICTSLTTLVVASMVLHLIIYCGAVTSSINPDYIPFFTILALLTVLLCPFNLCYRSSRLLFLRCMKRIFFSPFYKVVMVDFFLADQLTSQVAAIRSTQFVACYYFGGHFLSQNLDICASREYHQVTYFLSFLPYWWRLLQCIRRWVDEGDHTHLTNAGKYLSAMVAVGTRLTYQYKYPSMLWLTLFTIASSVATLYQMYWDIVMDWGLLRPRSHNPWLRDQLILKKKCLYFISMGINFILRFAWIQSLSHFQVGRSEHYLLDFLFASLEVFRRGHWNFYRLENEHLNNVGKYRAIKTVPLPFRDDFVGKI